MKLFILATTLSCIGVVQVHAQSAQLIPLGDLPGGPFYSTTFAMSSDGKYVAGRSDTSDAFDGIRAFRWSASTGLENLGDLPGGLADSTALGISSNGRYVAGISSASEGNRGFIWSQSTGMINVGTLGGGGQTSLHGISDDGSIAAGVWDSNGTSRAVRWTANGGLENLGVLLGGEAGFSGVQNMSRDGQVLVGTSSSATGALAFRWTKEFGMTPLDDLPGRTVNNWAYGASTDCRWVVGQSTGPEGQHAVLWNSAGEITDLGILGAGSWATGVSDDARVIIGNAEVGPFIWTPDTGMVRARVVFKDHGLDLAALGYDLRELTDISADGQWMCGMVRNPDGHFEAAMFYLPAPGTVGVLIGAGVLATRRRTRA